MRTLLYLAIAVAVIVVIAYVTPLGNGIVPKFGGGPAQLAGSPAVSYQVARLGGGTDALDSYRGKVVLMNLWATWCPPCREEMPALERFYGEYRDRGVVVLGVDQGESAAVAGAFVRAHGVTFPILLDEDQQYGRSYAALGLPTSIVVGRDGHVVRGIDGELTLAQMRNAVAPALAVR
jgi:thiol-disulfide isomerase/thioredoxin